MCKEEKEIRKNELQIIKLKADYIADHSLYILENLSDKNFMDSFTNYLLSDDEITFNGIPEKINPRVYYSSLSVIFKVCENLQKLGLNNEQSKQMRDKLRLYTKYFKQIDIDLTKASSFVQININQLSDSLENEEKTKTK